MAIINSKKAAAFENKCNIRFVIKCRNVYKKIMKHAKGQKRADLRDQKTFWQISVNKSNLKCTCCKLGAITAVVVVSLLLVVGKHQSLKKIKKGVLCCIFSNQIVHQRICVFSELELQEIEDMYRINMVQSNTSQVKNQITNLPSVIPS